MTFFIAFYILKEKQAENLNFSRLRRPSHGAPSPAGGRGGGERMFPQFIAQLLSASPIYWKTIDVLTASAVSLSLTGQSSQFTALHVALYSRSPSTPSRALVLKKWHTVVTSRFISTHHIIRANASRTWALLTVTIFYTS